MTESRYGATRSAAILPGTKTVSASLSSRTARSIRSSGFPAQSQAYEHAAPEPTITYTGSIGLNIMLCPSGCERATCT